MRRARQVWRAQTVTLLDGRQVLRNVKEIRAPHWGPRGHVFIRYGEVRIAGTVVQVMSEHDMDLPDRWRLPLRWTQMEPAF